MDPKVSIIIPVYKVEKYLRRSLDSVTAQTLKDIEIILIDDGSPDSSGKICDEFAEKDSRIKVIHQENAGASAARNSGLEIASGKYIGFVDSDDYSAPNMFELLYDLAEKTGADFAMCEYRKIDEKQALPTVEISSDSIEYKVVDAEEAFRLITIREEVFVTIWNKLFRKDLVQDMLYDPEMQVCHDVDYLIKAVSKSRKVVYLPYALYGYFVQRPGSLTSKADHDQDLDWNVRSYHRDISKVMDEVSITNPEMKDMAMAYKCIAGDITLADAMVRAGKIDKTAARKIRKDILTNLFSVIKSGFHIKSKINALVFLVSPGLYKILKRKKLLRKMYR